MSSIFVGVWSSHLLRTGALLTVLNVATGAFAYGFQLVMGQALSATDYTVFNSILALSMVICSPIGAPQVVASRHVTIVATTAGIGTARYLYQSWSRTLSLACAAMAMAIALNASFLRTFLRLPDSESLWLLAAIVILNVVSLVNGSFLQGLHAFRWLGLLPFASVVVKIGLCVFLVSVCKWGLHGALAGVAASAALFFLAATWGVMSCWGGSPPRKAPTPAFPFALVVPVIASAIGFTNMTQLDIVLVNRYFDRDIASEFALAAILGKAVLYLPGGLVTAILPIVAASEARRETSTGHAAHAIGATAVLCGAAAMVCFFAGPLVVHLLYGQKYGNAGGLLSLYGFAMVPMALAIVIQGFLIARGRSLFCWVAAGLSALEMVVINAWHPSLPAVIATIAFFNTMLVTLGGALMIPSFLERADPLSCSAIAE
jgi:O-antigen/teichoic acid export membrane protein